MKQILTLLFLLSVLASIAQNKVVIKVSGVGGGSGGGTGTVTSVGTGFGLTGGPVTTLGTIQIDTNSTIYKAWILAHSGSSSVPWGGIIGTLSSQTDLQNALNLKMNFTDTTGKWIGSGFLASLMRKSDTSLLNLAARFMLYQPLLNLTTIGTSGPSSLIGNTINIPQYSGGGGFSGISDAGTLPQLKITFPCIGYSSSADSVAHYGFVNIDTFNHAISNQSYFLTSEYGAWMTSNLTGGWIKLMLPYIVTIGNSIVGGHPADSSVLETSFSHALKYGTIAYGLSTRTNMPSLNLGVGGQTSTQIRARFLRDAIGLSGIFVNDGFDVVGGVPNKRLHKPSLIVIEGAINDIGNGIPLATTEANVLWMVQQCAIYNIPCVVLNCVGQGGGFYGASALAEVTQLNTWMASGVLNIYGAAVIDINSFWNSGVYGGVSAYNNDNDHYNTTYVSGGAVHFTKDGYDSIAAQIVRVANVPKLTKMIFQSVLDPVNPPANFNRPTAITINGTAYSLANNPIDTISITTPIINDTATITITGTTNITGSSTQAGWNAVYAILDNNPTNQLVYHASLPFSGDNTGDISANTVHIQANNYGWNPSFWIRNALASGVGNYGLYMTSSPYNSTMVFNGLTDTAAGRSGLASVVFGVKNGSIYTDHSVYADGTISQIGGINIGGSNPSLNYAIEQSNNNAGMAYNSVTEMTEMENAG